MKRNIREYKKKYFICKDDNGKMIYMGDTVEVHDPIETKTTYQSVVYWNRLDGAFIDQHPAHKSMGLNSHRDLKGFIGKQDRSTWVYLDGSDDEKDSYWDTRVTKCIKVKSFNTL